MAQSATYYLDKCLKKSTSLFKDCMVMSNAKKKKYLIVQRLYGHVGSSSINKVSSSFFSPDEQYLVVK